MTRAAEHHSTEDIIIGFIRDRFLYGREDAELTGETALLEERLIDSIQLMQLVQFLQERFGIMIEVTDLVPENFASVRVMTALVDKQKG